MKDKFADLEEPKKRLWPAAVLIALFVVGLFALHFSQAKPERLTGTIESIGSNGSGPVTVRLDSGATVAATSSFSGSLNKGDYVVVMEDRSSLSGPVFQVTGKDSSPEP